MSRLPSGSDRQADLFANIPANDDAAPPAIVAKPIGRGRSVPIIEARYPSEEEMASRLEESGRYRILRQLVPRPLAPIPEPWPKGMKLGVVLDTETTGLDHGTQEVIELGMVAFTYDDAGRIHDVVDVFSGLRQPSHPITPEITRITGITDEMARG